MPCYDGCQTAPGLRSDDRLSAALCALMKVLAEHNIKLTAGAFDDAGITLADFRAWQENHEEKDRKRRQREDDRKTLKEIESRLSADELRVLRKSRSGE